MTAHAQRAVCYHLSACLSVTWVDQSKTIEVRIMQLYHSQVPVVLWYKFNPDILTGSH